MKNMNTIYKCMVWEVKNNNKYFDFSEEPFDSEDSMKRLFILVIVDVLFPTSPTWHAPRLPLPRLLLLIFAEHLHGEISFHLACAHRSARCTFFVIAHLFHYLYMFRHLCSYCVRLLFSVKKKVKLMRRATNQ